MTLLSWRGAMRPKAQRPLLAPLDAVGKNPRREDAEPGGLRAELRKKKASPVGWPFAHNAALNQWWR